MIQKRLLSTLLAAPLLLLGAAAPTALASQGGPRLDRFERQLIAAVNAQRAGASLAPLRASRRLVRAADYHSREMMRGGFFAHDSRTNGWTWNQRIQKLTGLRRAGEVLAWVPYRTRGADDARDVVALWMQSPPHRASLLDPSYTRIGPGRRVGRYRGQTGSVFTLDLASIRRG